MTNAFRLVTILSTVLAMAPPAAADQPNQAPTRPNIVFMLTDNLGYGDVGVYGGGAVRGAPTPLPNEAFQDDSLNNYQNVLREIDFNTGRILDAIDEHGMKGNTIVIWASDNGPQTLQGPNIQYGGQGDTGPFRSEFPSGWEGAIRTPCIIRWPGNVRAGRVSNEIVSMLDFYRTLAHAAGASNLVPKDRLADGFDLTDFILGTTEESPRDYIITILGEDLLALKWRNFKLHPTVMVPAPGVVRQAGQGVLTAYKETPSHAWVFDVEADPKELWNIVATSTWVSHGAAKAVRKPLCLSLAKKVKLGAFARYCLPHPG